MKRLGHGGYGVVYQAIQQELETHVVLKFLKREHHGQYDRIEQFKREARAPAKVRSGVVKCLDYYDDLDGFPCQVLEYIHGPNLRTYLKQEGGQLPFDMVLRIGCQLAKTLEAAHDAGIVHRDLTPGNIMLTDETLPTMVRVKVIDWGISAWLGRDASMTGAPDGNPPPPYLPPEDSDPVRPAYDLFVFGVLLYEMLVGQPPEPSGFVTTRDALEGLPALHNYPEPLRKLIAKCLQRGPHDRPSSQQARQHLERLLFDEQQRPVRELHDSLHEAAGQIKLLETQADQHRKRAEVEADQAHALQARFEACDRTLQQTREQLKARDQAHAGLVHQLERLRATQENLANRSQALAQERDAAQNERDAAQQSVAVAREARQRAETRVGELEARVDLLRSEIEKARSSWLSERNELQSKLTSSEETARMSRTERERQLDSDVRAYLDELERQRVEIEQQKARAAEAEQQLCEVQDKQAEAARALRNSHASLARAVTTRRYMVAVGIALMLACMGATLAVVRRWPALQADRHGALVGANPDAPSASPSTTATMPAAQTSPASLPSAATALPEPAGTSAAAVVSVSRPAVAALSSPTGAVGPGAKRRPSRAGEPQAQGVAALRLGWLARWLAIQG